MSANTRQTAPGDFFYGWDLLYKTIENAVSKNSDLLIALVHFLFTKHYNFRCVGVGDDKTLSDDEIGSELLPDNWNDDVSKYALRYRYEKQLYLLLGNLTEDSLIINFLDINTKKVSNICIDPTELVKATRGPINKLIPSVSEITDRFRRELLEPVFTGNRKETTTQTTSTSSSDHDPLRISRPLRPPVHFRPVGYEPRPFGFPDVGRGDLDPLSRGPGNLMQFPSHPSVHGPGQPRFDPYGPPDPNVRPNPNPDHLNPPTFGGDYYM